MPRPTTVPNPSAPAPAAQPRTGCTRVAPVRTALVLAGLLVAAVAALARADGGPAHERGSAPAAPALQLHRSTGEPLLIVHAPGETIPEPTERPIPAAAPS